MPRLADARTNFNAGIIGPRLVGRPDLAKYANGVRRALNMVFLPQGSAQRRGAFRHLATAKYTDKKPWLLPFVFSVEQAYGLEWGDLYMRPYKDKAPIVATLTITGAANNGSGLVRITSAAHGLANGSRVTITGVLGTTEANGTWEISGVATNTFDLVASAYANAYVSGGTATWREIVSPYAHADLPALGFCQSYDQLFLVHRSYRPRVLSRFSHINWTLAVLELIDGPWLAANTDTGKTLTPSAQTGTITIAATGHAPFKSNHVGRLVRLQLAAGTGKWGWCEITGFTNTAQVTALVKGEEGLATGQLTAAAATPTSHWQLGLYNDDDGWPDATTFHEERFFLNGPLKTAPSRADGSMSQQFTTFKPGTADGDAVAYNIASNDVNVIRWFASMRDLMVGAQSKVFRIGADRAEAALAPTNALARAVAGFGTAAIKPAIVGTAALFVQRHKKKLRELVYDIAVDGWQTNDMNLISDSIADAQFRQLAFQEEPHGIVWACLEDGAFLGFTYNRDQSVYAWHPHQAGGDGKMVSCCVIPGIAGDELYGAFERENPAGGLTYSIEVMERGITDTTPPEDQFFLDAGLTIDNTALSIAGSNCTLTPAAVSGASVAITAGAAIFQAGDVGRKIRRRYVDYAGSKLGDGKDKSGRMMWKTAVAEILVYNGPTSVTCKIHAAFPDLDPVPAAEWRLTVSSVSGLTHLAGWQVGILADGAWQPLKTVSVLGAIDLDVPAATVHVGLVAPWLLLTMPHEPPSAEGSSLGKPRRISKVHLRFDRTLGVKFGPWDGGETYDLDERSTADVMNEPPPLISGVRTVAFDKGWEKERDADVLLRGEKPFNVTLCAVVPIVSTSDGA